jgi:hypothetical protein
MHSEFYATLSNKVHKHLYRIYFDLRVLSRLDTGDEEI